MNTTQPDDNSIDPETTKVQSAESSKVDLEHYRNEIKLLNQRVTKLKQLNRRVTKLEANSPNLRILALDRAAQEMVQELLSYMTPADPVGLEFERVGRDFDGGYVMVKHEARSKIAYSLGINRDVSWDMAMAERGYNIYQYDHTIEKLPLSHPNFHYRRLGITGTSSTNNELSSLGHEITVNNHAESRDIVLKIDIEGHEWEVFNEISSDDLSRFTQILVECHGFDRVHKLFWYRKARQALGNLATTHQVVHVHGNNNSQMLVLGGIPIPKTLELTWLRRDICDFSPCTRTFPTALDQPNNPNYADHRLGRFSFF